MFSESTSNHRSNSLGINTGLNERDVDIIDIAMNQDQDTNQKSTSAEPLNPTYTTYDHLKDDLRPSGPTSTPNLGSVSATSNSNEGASSVMTSDWSHVPCSIPRIQCPVPGYDFSSYNDGDWDMDDCPSPTDTEIIEVELSLEEIHQDLKARGITVRDFAFTSVKESGMSS
ncbi:hypothetical protein GGU10DRAFT_184726 [Lentinula aff. detonsa]|uniref:Uncharacterized protein n=1 Tax=Lentinula aff. detonsa TaxID=2804958 RepID=A0AA38KSL1_9AGAR|nr:hypothetical protein GGU10DRAFT_184726 [Lentinula aff. detonsa]